MVFTQHFKLFIFLQFVLVLNSCKKEIKTDSEHQYTNDLVHETSPYLQQHANNPVNWKAWSPELFETAEKENKLVLISIGYSSCHWCHVMEKETFEDIGVAELMNTNFINIKVDREERPDVDQVYQTAIQLIGQGGGWPLNVIALPNGKPLFLETYLPKEQWQKVLVKISKMFADDPEKANEYANSLSKGIQEMNFLERSYEFENLTNNTLREGINIWRPKWDLNYGGNQGRQKFITPNSLIFLLDYAVLNEDKEALEHIRNTLDKIANGGIYDQIGGGFYRYSTDQYWRIPHFEKMLYDNAQAISLYAKAYQVFKVPMYKEIVYQTIGFLEREMKNKEGGYFATLDADSDGEEGKYYVWTEDELFKLLGDDMSLFSTYYNIDADNIWEENKYVLHKSRVEEDFLSTNVLKPNDFSIKKAGWHEKLLKARSTRKRPTTDDKIITSWNALLIKGFTDAYNVFGEESFLVSAEAVFDFIISNSYSKGYLLHSYKKGSKRKEGFLEDYAFLIDATLQLYSTTLNSKYLKFASKLMDEVQNDFTDEASGMFTFNKEQELISKIIKTNDGEIPSPNSVMAHNFLQIGHINYNPEYLNKAKTMLATIMPQLTEYTDAYTHWGSLLLHISQPYFEIAIVGENAQMLTAELKTKHIPNTLIVGTTEESEASLFKDRYVEGETLIYVCKNSTCKFPVKTVDEALRQLANF